MLMNAVRVFPDPVGEDTRTFFLSCIIGTALDCGSERRSNLSSNHVETRGSISPITSSFVYALSDLSIFIRLSL